MNAKRRLAGVLVAIVSVVGAAAFRAVPSAASVTVPYLPARSLITTSIIDGVDQSKFCLEMFTYPPYVFATTFVEEIVIFWLTSSFFSPVGCSATFVCCVTLGRFQFPDGMLRGPNHVVMGRDWSMKLMTG